MNAKTVAPLILGAMLSIPAPAWAARYSGYTTQHLRATLLTSRGQVTSYTIDWNARCPRLRRVFHTGVAYSLRRDRYDLPIVSGRFYDRFSFDPFALDSGGTRATGWGRVSGRVGATSASGYLYETLNILGPDGRTVVDTCRSGRIGWTLRRLA